MWVDRKYLSVHAGVSYSRPILILNQLERKKTERNGAGIGICRPESTGSDASHLCDLSLWGKETSSVLNGIISSVLRRVLREMKIQMCDRYAHAWADWKIHIWLEGDDVQSWLKSKKCYFAA